jgi:antitoxin component YwqK of YwqJK toxin-antitoxin module
MELLKFFIVSRDHIGIKVCNLIQGVNYDFNIGIKCTCKDGKLNEECQWTYNYVYLHLERCFSYLKHDVTHAVLHRYWYENGQLYEEYNFVDGNPHGSHRHTIDDVQLKCERCYVNGTEHGLCHAWYFNGILYKKYNYIHGKLQN